MLKKQISLFAATFIFIGFFFMAMPEEGYSGTMPLPPGCCQYIIVSPENGFFCEDITGGICEERLGVGLLDFFPGESCNEETNLCPSFRTSSIPTLSEWGLVAMAGVLGIIGFMVIRRRKVAA